MAANLTSPAPGPAAASPSEPSHVPAPALGARAASPLRILWVGSKLEWGGGIGRVVAEATRALAARGHDVHAAGPAPDGDPGPVAGVTLHPWPRRRFKFQNVPALVRLQRRLRPDLIHFHSALPHGELVATLRALRAGRRRPGLVVTAHTSVRTDYPKRRARLGLRAADVVIEPSAWARRHAIRAGAPEQVTWVIHGGIELQEAESPREPVVAMLGRLVRLKGAHLLIEAFDRVAARHPEWQLWIAGVGPERSQLEAQAARTDSASRIRFLGHVSGPEKRRVLSACAIGVMPSLHESMGAVLLELQAYGTPCIASDVGGLPEIACHGEGALLVKPDDPAALTEALEVLIGDPSRRRQLGEAGRRCASRLSWSHIAAQYERVYMDLLS